MVSSTFAANIYMCPPNLLVLPQSSGWNIYPANNVGSFGVVEKINYNTLGFNVGNVVFYNNQDVVAILLDSITYNIVEEGQIKFIEAGTPVAP